MNQCVFTIVAKNYIGLAAVLERSIRDYYNDFDFYIIVADEVDKDDCNFILPSNCLIGREILNLSADLWNELSFKYNLTEFCTSIKPACFLYLFERYEKVIYLDPDILFVNTIEPVFDELSRFKMVLTPHIVTLPKVGLADTRESIWLSCGIYNLGFLAASKSSATLDVITWWHERLLRWCFIDTYESLFTDQKWIDFIPGFLTSEELLISKDLGRNFAPWNFFERCVFDEGGTLKVSLRNEDMLSNMSSDLMFIHFSAYDYTKLIKGVIDQKGVNIKNKYEDINIVLIKYQRTLMENSQLFERYIRSSYTYNFFMDGTRISPVHRRLYRGMVVKGRIINNPFDSGRNSFLSQLRKKGLIASESNHSVDGMTKNNLPGIRKQLKYFNLLTRLLFSIMGYGRYFLFVKLLRSYSRTESHIHLFDRKYDSDNIF